MGVAVVCVAQFVVVLDATIVATALPAIGQSLGFSVADLQWVITGYTLVFSGLLILGGRLADLYGPRVTFVAGLLLFMAASAGCALAWSPSTLVGARVVEGLGAAVLSPAALALLGTMSEPGPSRRRAIGWWTAAAATGGASGWVLGGLLTEFLGWRSVFWVNLPICMAALAVAKGTLPAGARSRGARLDLVGALAATAALGLLVYGLVGTGERGLVATTSWVPMAVASILLIFLTRHEGRLADPLVPAALVRSRPVVAANLTALALTAATTPAMFLSILYVQRVLRFSPAHASMLFPAFNVAVIIGSLGGPYLLRRAGARRTLVSGFVSVGAGATLLAALPPAEPAVAHLLAAFTLMGIGLGAASVASTQTGTEAAQPAHQGVASGILNSAAQLGTVLGLAVVTPLATRGGSPTMDDFQAGYTAICAIAGAGALASLLAHDVQDDLSGRWTAMGGWGPDNSGAPGSSGAGDDIARCRRKCGQKRQNLG